MQVVDSINRYWLLYLGIAAAWTTVFSCFNRRPLRGFRNFGILGAYIVGVVMAFRLPWRQSVATWAVYGLVAGISYFLYDLVSFLRSSEKEKDDRPRLSTLLNGFIVWPIMLPEVIEYSLAGAGILKPPSVAVGNSSMAGGSGGQTDQS